LLVLLMLVASGAGADRCDDGYVMMDAV